MKVVTSNDIKAATGIKNAATLTRWHRQGLIPPPENKEKETGKGRISCWPEWVLHRSIRIKQLINAGWRLQKIQEEIGDWRVDEERYQRRFKPTIEQAQRNTAFWNLEDIVSDVLRATTGNFAFLTEKSKQTVLEDGFVEKVIPMIHEGINPVIVIAGRDVYLTADFLVSDYLADHRNAEHAISVIPIGREITSFISVGERLPRQPTIRPSNSVVESHEDGEVQLTFWSVDTWGFEISDGPRPKPSPSWGKPPK